MYNRGFTDAKNIKALVGNSESVVFYRNVGGIGDAVMIVPSITAYRKQYGKDVKMIVATVSYCLPVFYNNPDVDYIVNTDQFKSTMDCRIFFEYIGSLFIQLSDPCPCSIYESSHEPLILKSRQELFAEACGVEFLIENNRMFVSDLDNKIAKKSVGYDKYIVVHCSSNSKFRSLPHAHVDYLVKYLAKRLNPIGVVLISHDWKYKYSKYDNVTRVISSPMNHIIAIINNSIGLIGPDSMGVHVAGALGIPSYGIFGMTDPKCRMLYDKAGWYSGYHRCKKQHCWYHPCLFRFCLNAINIKDVAEKFLTFLGGYNEL